MKHIVLVGNTSWGMYNFRKNLIQYFLISNYRVSVIAPYDDIYSNKLKELGCNFYPIILNQKGKNIFNDLIYLFNLFIVYNKLKPTFIFHYTIKPNIYGSIAAKFANIKSVAVVTGLGSSYLNGKYLNAFIFYLYKIAFNFPIQIWFLNSFDKDIFINKNIIPINKSFILKGEGISLNDYHPLFNNLKNVEFLFVGRLLRDKGIFEYVESAKIVKTFFPNIKFKIVGYLGYNNPTAIDSEYIYKNHNDGIIEYFGESDNVSDFISNSSCIILPSYREGLSRVLLEAAILERPIIATNIAGCNEVVIDNYNGLLCNVKSIDSLIKSIFKFINLPHETRILMGINGRKHVIKNFSEEIVFDQYNNFLDSQFV